MDQGRKEIFVCKFEQKGTTADLSLLPSCASNLNLHTKRVNCIARFYKQASNSIMNLDDPIFHGSYGNDQAAWDENPIPEDLPEQLIEEEKGDDAELAVMSDDSD